MVFGRDGRLSFIVETAVDKIWLGKQTNTHGVIIVAFLLAGRKVAFLLTRDSIEQIDSR